MISLVGSRSLRRKGECCGEDQVGTPVFASDVERLYRQCVVCTTTRNQLDDESGFMRGRRVKRYEPL